MWRGAGLQRKVIKKEEEATQHVVAVAIDADKNSQHALKWAADNVVLRGQIFYLLHVRQKVTSIPTPTGQQISINEVDDSLKTAFLEQMDAQSKELLLPFQCFCSRRGLPCKEVILDDTDVSKAISDFVMHQSVDKLVLGASSRGALARTFKQADVPTAVSKLAPDFCTVYVISKGKISSVRPATRTITNNNRRLELLNEPVANQFQSTKSGPDARSPSQTPERSALHRTNGRPGNAEPETMNREQQSVDYLNHSYQSVASCPSPSRISFTSNNPNSRETFESVSRPNHLARNFNDHNYSHEKQKTSSDSNSTSGPYWSAGSAGSGNEQFFPSRTEESIPSWHSSSSTEECIDAELQQLKDLLKNKQGLLDKIHTEEHNKIAEPYNLSPHKLEIPMPRGYTRKSYSPLQTEISAEGNQRDKYLLNAVPDNGAMPDNFSSVVYRKYSIEDIQKATNYFSPELKIGEGGYGPVYKSTLDNTLVAIKVLSSDATQGMKQFHQEVEVLSRMRHPNMVQLMGACPESGCLVYEYMANGSLEDRLFCLSGTAPLSWQLRFKLAGDIASALLFLHQTKPEPLVHRDLKPANILLDHNFNGKIADVGLARLIPRTADTTTQLHMTAAAGTFCYIDPEYQKTGMVSTKSDIYALGIILLQLITGRQPMGLAYHVDEAMDSGNIIDLLDPKVKGWPMEETLSIVKLGLQCAELKRKDRPDLASVVFPELNRLRAFAEAAGGTSLKQQQRTMSYKETFGASDIEFSNFLDERTKKGSTFTG